MPARSADCKCTPSFTCGHCLRAAKPWHFTPSTTIAPRVYAGRPCNTCGLPESEHDGRELHRFDDSNSGRAR